MLCEHSLAAWQARRRSHASGALLPYRSERERCKGPHLSRSPVLPVTPAICAVPPFPTEQVRGHNRRPASLPPTRGFRAKPSAPHLGGEGRVDAKPHRSPHAPPCACAFPGRGREAGGLASGGGERASLKPMNYRHAFHAGNSRRRRNAILARILIYLERKATPFRFIDTHAGAGRYDLASEAAGRSPEWRGGAYRAIAVLLVFQSANGRQRKPSQRGRIGSITTNRAGQVT